MTAQLIISEARLQSDTEVSEIRTTDKKKSGISKKELEYKQDKWTKRFVLRRYDND